MPAGGTARLSCRLRVQYWKTGPCDDRAMRRPGHAKTGPCLEHRVRETYSFVATFVAHSAATPDFLCHFESFQAPAGDDDREARIIILGLKHDGDSYDFCWLPDER